MAGRVFQKSGGAVNTSSVSRFKKDSDSPGGDGLVPCIVKSVVAGLASAGVLLLLVSIAATIYAIPEAVVNYVVIGISVLCLFIVGFSAAAVLKKDVYKRQEYCMPGLPRPHGSWACLFLLRSGYRSCRGYPPCLSVR